MRLFTAIDIPPEIKDNLRKLIDRLRPTADLTWSRAENLHITTKFIGEWPEDRLAELKRALAQVPMIEPIDIAIRGLGWFPNARQPRVFWAGVEGGDALKHLAAETDRATSRLGVPVENRSYSPHLTLARLKDRPRLNQLREAVANLTSQDFGTFRATSFFLYLSAGGKYTKLAEFPSKSR
jgi:2'-5' RNA ligase